VQRVAQAHRLALNLIYCHRLVVCQWEQQQEELLQVALLQPVVHKWGCLAHQFVYTWEQALLQRLEFQVQAQLCQSVRLVFQQQAQLQWRQGWLQVQLQQPVRHKLDYLAHQ
jgi:hypothetical protein